MEMALSKENVLEIEDSKISLPMIATAINKRAIIILVSGKLIIFQIKPVDGTGCVDLFIFISYNVTIKLAFMRCGAIAP